MEMQEMIKARKTERSRLMTDRMRSEIECDYITKNIALEIYDYLQRECRNRMHNKDPKFASINYSIAWTDCCDAICEKFISKVK